MMNKLRALPSKPPKRTITGYYMRIYPKRIEFITGVLDAMKLSNPEERMVVTELLWKPSLFITNSSTNITTQIFQEKVAKYNRELRAELFHSDKDAGKDGVQHRLSSSNIQDDDLDAILKYNRNIQEKIAENMPSMTSTMKERALAASAIIKKHIGRLEMSDKLTDVNAVELKKESLKLEEHTNSKERWWDWWWDWFIMIAFVLGVFCGMVLNIYTVKRPTSAPVGTGTDPTSASESGGGGGATF
ncbi:PREDICTED: vesicle transport protein USE1-like isoform X2 [Vollenhovia emeryi]|uniref:vesicle transport protein USE1-like isoform X2 n=1 Tax=Vollenhovia emeryi TaxID=411798 RepID=UPI0005F4E1B0|nr:PREDICTED: vesicle transport protein USE1-like isoform X2 [Vollenhovia emeryi]